MAHFTNAIKTVISRSFGDKMTALATSAGMHGPDIGKLIREEVPLTAAKLEKILDACEPEDRTLLVHAAVRDFVGEQEYHARFTSAQTSNDVVQEDLGGPRFHAHFPIHPRAEQVLRYLINNVQRNADIEEALILLGKFLELPAPLETVKASPADTPEDKLKAAIRKKANAIRAEANANKTQRPPDAKSVG